MNAPLLFLDLDHPLDVARRFRASVRPYLIRQNGIWHDYVGTHYRPIEDSTIRSAVQDYLGRAFVGKLAINGETMQPVKKDDKPKALGPQPYDVRHVVEMLAQLPEVHKPAATYKSPSWLGVNDGDPRAILPCLNGLFDLDTRELRPHTPEFFCTYCLPLEYKPDVAVPKKWLDTLNEIFAGRQHLVDGLQEAFGYAISQDRSYEKIFYHRGVPRSGKGLIFTVLRHLVGESNTASFSFGGSESTLGDKHGLSGAENALLLQIPDITVGRHTGGHGAACTRLKEISGGDLVPIRPLFSKTEYMVLPGLLQCGSNGIPNFGHDADALAARLLFWPHDVSFKGREDVTLKDRRKSPFLTVEALTGILNWAVAGLDRLNARGRFEEWPESFEIKRLMLRESNLIVAFIDSECELKSGVSVDKMTLWHAYRDWCAAQGMDFKIEHYFSGELQRAAINLGTVLKDRRAYTDDGKRPRDWIGIRLNADNRIKYYEHDQEMIDMLSPDGLPTLRTLKTEARSGRKIPKSWSSPEDEREHASGFEPGGDQSED
jgi:putative DNA primase/helicase